MQGAQGANSATRPQRHGQGVVLVASLFLVAARGQEPLVASLLLVVMPFAPSSVLAPSSDFLKSCSSTQDRVKGAFDSCP